MNIDVCTVHLWNIILFVQQMHNVQTFMSVLKKQILLIYIVHLLNRYNKGKELIFIAEYLTL